MTSQKIIDLSGLTPKIKAVAKAMDSLNNYNNYRKFTQDELFKGITAEVAFKMHLGMRPTFELFLDTNGDGGNDVKGYDVKYIPENGKYLILYSHEVDKSLKYVAIKVSSDFTKAAYIGEITNEDFKKKCIHKDFGYGQRLCVLLTDLDYKI